jgi:hypothetical protein
MISDRQHIHPLGTGLTHQFSGAQGTVGGGGVAVQIVVAGGHDSASVGENQSFYANLQNKDRENYKLSRNILVVDKFFENAYEWLLGKATASSVTAHACGLGGGQKETRKAIFNG